MSKCPNKIVEECMLCEAHCYCDKWKGYQQGREDAIDEFLSWFDIDVETNRYSVKAIRHRSRCDKFEAKE